MKSKSSMLFAAAVFALGVASASAQERLTSKHGADDQAGASNLITPEKAKQAAGLIKQGKTYPLARTYEAKMPLFGARVFALRATGGLAGGPAGDNKVPLRLVKSVPSSTASDTSASALLKVIVITTV
jgi:hypothetical protein